MSIKVYSTELEELLSTGSEHVDHGNRSKIQKSVYGSFSANNFLLPNIYTMDVSWNTDTDLILHESEDSGSTIDFSFVMQGDFTSNFSGIRQELIMSESHHNFKFSPGKSHHHKLVKDQNLKIFHVSILRDFFSTLIGCEDRWSESILRKIENHEPFVGSNSPLLVTPLMIHLIESLRSRQSEGAISNLRCQSVLFELLAIQLEQCKLGDNKNSFADINVRDKEKLYALHAYLQQNFLNDLSLSSLCRVSTLNEFKLKKGFRTLFNTSVFGYVKQLRMEYASRLIRDDRKSIEEVSEILGYEYSNHFSAAFKKHYGTSPSAWYNS